jgi:hypothetical protein
LAAVRGPDHHQGAQTKIFLAPLETKNGFANFFVATRGGVRAPDGPGPGDGHRSCPVPLVTILLYGGFGYAHLRLLSLMALDHRLRPPL